MSCDGSIISDCHAGQNRRITANPNVIANNGYAFFGTNTNGAYIHYRAISPDS
jgi:hypothetical protein